jgi:hypothetical protein
MIISTKVPKHILSFKACIIVADQEQQIFEKHQDPLNKHVKLNKMGHGGVTNFTYDERN